jgi:hypothetical protein
MLRVSTAARFGVASSTLLPRQKQKAMPNARLRTGPTPQIGCESDGFMKTTSQLSALLLGAAIAFTPALGMSQQTAQPGTTSNPGQSGGATGNGGYGTTTTPGESGGTSGGAYGTTNNGQTGTTHHKKKKHHKKSKNGGENGGSGTTGGAYGSGSGSGGTGGTGGTTNPQ